MEIKMEYIRKPTASYMVLPQAGTPRNWEQQMIAHAKGGNILFAECVGENGQNYLWYDITGKQSVDTLLETEDLHYEMLCRILMGIYEAMEYLEEMLLPAENLLLFSEGILADYRKGEIYLCYYPGNEAEVQDAFRELLEYLLTKLDHTDTRAVELAYGIYEDVSKGGMNLGQLKALLHLPYEQEDAGMPEETACEQTGYSVSGKAGCGTMEQTESEWQHEAEQGMPDRAERGVLGAQEYDMTDQTDRGSGGAGRKTGLCSREKVWKRVEECLQKFQNILGQGGRRHRKTSAKKEEPFFFEPETEEEPQTAHPTVLLAELTKPPEGLLRYEGKGFCSDLTVKGESFLIGSDAECDGYIPSTTVSRKHARITLKEGIYFIEDLNSSNGTYVGGEMLNYKTKMSLQRNEIVIFADEKFRFI